MTTRFAEHLLSDEIANIPDPDAVPQGTLFASTDEDIIYQSNGVDTWSEWLPAGGGGTAIVPWAIAPIGGAPNITHKVWGANNALYAACVIPADCTITGIRIIVGVSNGNISVALYDTSGNRLATSGAVACPSAGAQSVSFTGSYAATAGRYYMALSTSSSSASFAVNQQVSSSVGGPFPGIYQNTAHPCPDPGTISAANVTSCPTIIGLVSGGFP